MATSSKPTPQPARVTPQPAKKAAPGKPAASRQRPPLFGRENYKWMLIGLIIVSLGLILMAGGKSKDPNVFDPREVYSFTRITIAPILILGGFVVEIFAIFVKSKTPAPGEANNA